MTEKNEDGTFQYQSEDFADVRILRYPIPGFEQLSERKKLLLYYFYKAALSGRDIIWDQNCKYNLYVRNVLEHIYNNRERIPPYLLKRREDWEEFVVFLKQIWVHNGIHHGYSNEKLIPGFSRTWLRMIIELGTGFPKDSVVFRYKNPRQVEGRYIDIYEILFNPEIVPVKVCKAPNVDKVKGSAVNFYENITQKEAEEYYKQMADEDKDNPRPVPYGLDTKLVKKKDSKFVSPWVSEREQPHTAFSDDKPTDPNKLIYEISFSKIYAKPIADIYHWLSLAMITTESPEQRESLTLLAEYLLTGNLETFNKYCIAWLNDKDYDIDIIGPAFVETYGDPLDYTGSFETVVTVRDPEASRRMELLCENAQWFEDHSPVLKKHKKKEAKGINARVVNVVVESGEASPMTPIGINLPNSDWIRKEYGSKSINMDNIIDAHDKANNSSGALEEFYHSKETVERIKKYGDYAYKIEVDLHEVLGHGSGQLEKNVSEDSLKDYARVIEEARADLFALYYIADPKMIELGILPNEEAYKSVYDMYITGGLITQLKRVELGKDLQQTHMRNRQMICVWLAYKSEDEKVIMKLDLDGKTYYKICDYEILRKHIGELLQEVQRIKSSGDLDFAQEMVEFFGVKIDKELHKQVLERYKKLNIKPYSAFINPKLELDDSGAVVLSYPKNFAKQMLEYSRDYSELYNHPAICNDRISLCVKKA